MNMKSILKASLIGVLVWALVFTAFSILAFVPVVKDSLDLQASILAVLIVPFATLGATLYYKNGNHDHGLKVGLISVVIALSLDALITVPYIEIPNGGSYQSFFGYPLLYLLVAVNILTFYLYWRLKVMNKHEQ